jgi:probable F420-dependent oxidoreductase
VAINKVAAVTLPAGPKLEHSIERLKWAEEAGYTDAWFADAGAPDTLTQIAAIGHHTKSIRIGVAITPVYVRTPAVLAATANVINQVIPGRFVLGIGSSSHNIMTKWNGIPLDKPVTRVKETAIMVRSMMTGEKSNFQLDTLSSAGYRQPPMENPPPIYIAALRSKMIEMAAEVGDGVIFNLWPKGALPKMMEHVKIGAERAGKRFEDVEIVNRAMVLVTDDKARARDLFRASHAPYYATPVYNRFLAWAGYEDIAAEIAAGWEQKDRDRTTGALTEELVNEVIIIGSEDEVHERIQADADGGVHVSIIAPLGGATPEEVQRTYDAFRPDRFTLRQ